MAAQSTPLMLPAVVVGRSPEIRKKSSTRLPKFGHFCSNFVNPTGLFMNNKNKLVEAMDSRIVLFGIRKGWLGCGMLPFHGPNVLVSKNLMNLQLNRRISGTRIAYVDSGVDDVDSKVGDEKLKKLSRHDQIDVQNALFEYLHYTRSLNFTDAEHMSKNCPKFLQKLVAKVGHKQNVGSLVTRYLRYHPINEFEPFFESIGLKTAELYSLLPGNMLFLIDDAILLENYHILCNYGIPRSQIGKMYRDGIGIFRYECGVLSSKLEAYEKLGLSKPTVIKLVICCPTLLVGNMNHEFLQVLEKLKSLLVELDRIRSCLSDKSDYSWAQILDILIFLEKMGCTKHELASLIVKHPRFIFEDSGKKIYILVAMVLKLGLKMKDVLILLVQHPQILEGSFTKNLWEAVTFMTEIGMRMEDIGKIVSSHAQVLGASSCQRPDVVLKSLNQSASSLCDIIKKDPSQFGNLSSRRKSNSVALPRVDGMFLKEKTTFLLKLGYVENSEEMAKAVMKFRGRGDELQERYDCLVNAGLDCHTVSEMIKLAPQILNQSTSVIEEKIDYLFNHLGYPVETLASFPSFLCYNMEKIKVRFSMYNWLREQGVVLNTKNRKMINSGVAPSTILACSEARFMKYVVYLHPKGPKKWEKLKSSSSLS